MYSAAYAVTQPSVHRLKLKFRGIGWFSLCYKGLNDKNCSLSIVLTATDQKLQKS